MLEVIFKIVVTAVIASVAFGGIYAVWTKPIDIIGTLSKPFSFISFQKRPKLDVEVKQVTGAQFRGMPCLLFYVLRFVNTSGENITVKEIVLRVKGREDIDSTVITTGQVENPKGEKTESIIVQIGSPPRNANMVLVGWKNFRPILNEYRTLSPGAVLAGSAAYVIDRMTMDQFKQLKAVELVAIDFAGNEAAKQIDIAPEWLSQAENASVAEREFLSKGGQEIIWK
jgi:hypothetical protein